MEKPETQESWNQFLEYVKRRCSATAFGNWLAPIKVGSVSMDEIELLIPNVFVQDYLLSNYKADLCAFLPVKTSGEPSIKFTLQKKEVHIVPAASPSITTAENPPASTQVAIKLNDNYHFSTFIEGASNQFVKSAAMGVSSKPGQSYNPLFIHGGVGLGKTHILHSIGHDIHQRFPKLRIQCITTEMFINDLVDSLRYKYVDKTKHYYREEIDILLVDDIQFLQNRLNFEEEFYNMFETLVKAKKQVVITSDKPPGELKLSERLRAWFEWSLVAHMGVPDLETRVAILQSKAEQKGLFIPDQVAFFICEHIQHNVRQLEGAINRLSAHTRLMNLKITEETVERVLKEYFLRVPKHKINVDQIIDIVAQVFNVKDKELIRGNTRTKDIVLPRQVAMYLAKEMIKDSLMTLGTYFCKSHSTILHACKNIEERLGEGDEILQSQIKMIRHHLVAAG